MTWKSKAVKALAIIEGIVLVLVLGAWYLDKNSSDEGLLFSCGGAIYSSATSPDKQLTAYSFERDCGTTTGFSTFVIIRSTQNKLDLSAHLISDEIVLQANGDYHPQVRWLSKDNLVIKFKPSDSPQASEIWQQDLVHQLIHITYKGMSH